MSNKIFKEDSATLALLYSYIGNKSRILNEEVINQYDKIIDYNLEKNGSKSFIYPLDISKLSFFVTKDNHNTFYYVLKENFDYEKIMNDYFCWLPKDIVIASQQENALSVLGLSLINGKIEKCEQGPVKKLVPNNK